MLKYYDLASVNNDKKKTLGENPFFLINIDTKNKLKSSNV